MPNVRWLLVLLLAGALAGFLFYTARLTRLGPPLESPVVPGPALALTQSGQCKECHSQIYAEWQSDQHATAWSGDDFKTFTVNYTRDECLACHAPRPMLESGLTSNEPKLRASQRSDGVDCLACHMKNGKSHGTLGSRAVCGGILEPALKTAQACYHCHASHNLFKEYLASDYAKRGVTCQDCHMEQVIRPVADGGKPRATRKHFFHAGGHDAEALKKVLQLDLDVKAQSVTVTVTNVGAAHGVPGEINNRVIRLIVAVLEFKPGDPAAGPGKGTWQEVVAYRAFFQAPPRKLRDKVPSTQILPGEPRVASYELPIPNGKVVATLEYMLEKDTMLWTDATLMATAECSF